jgi:hypothetical protein
MGNIRLEEGHYTGVDEETSARESHEREEVETTKL